MLIIDGTSYLYRAYYTFPSLTNQSGVPSGAIYGVISMLRKLLLEYKNDQIITVFDTPKKNFRHTLFKHYKKNRPIMPSNLQDQIQPLYKIIKLIGIPVISIPSVEADDIIGTLSHCAEKSGLSVLISSNDKDMIQLVTENIRIINSMHNIIIGPNEVAEKYGISPILMIDLLALMGDIADSIPGIPGIGKKTALILLKHFGSLERIYQKIDDIKTLPIRRAKNITEKIKENKEMAFLSKKLSTIKLDIPISFNFHDLKKPKLKKKELLYFFHYYNFHKWNTQVHNNTWLLTKKQTRK